MIRTQPNLGVRGAAALVDYLVILGFDIWWITAFGTPDEEGTYSVTGFMATVPIIFWFLWLPCAEALTGRTFGKWIFGLIVLSQSGNKISFGQAVKRHIADVVDLFFFFGVVAIIAIRNSQLSQRLGDSWSKTIVVKLGGFNCTNCSRAVHLSVAEVHSRQFVCPHCNARVELTTVV